MSRYKYIATSTLKARKKKREKAEAKAKAKLETKARLRITGDNFAFDDSYPIHIFCRGFGKSACRSPNAVGLAVYEHGQLLTAYYGCYSDFETTNAAELRALYVALLVVKSLYRTTGPIKVFSNSTYAINSVIKYNQKWEKHNWKLGGGESRENRDMLMLLHEIYTKYSNIVEICHIPADAEVSGNKIAIGLAGMAVDQQLTALSASWDEVTLRHLGQQNNSIAKIPFSLFGGTEVKNMQWPPENGR